MNGKSLDKIDIDVVDKMVGDMLLAKFNDNNQFINSIRNHVNMNTSIDYAIPDVQNKVDILDNQVQYEPEYVEQRQEVQQISCEEKEQINKFVENEIKDSPKKIKIIKLVIISLVIAAILCYLIWKYVHTEYTYFIMIGLVAVILASDYYIYQKGFVYKIF